MKNIILAVTVALAIFASTGAFARGFSVGVLGSYAIDNGAIDKSVNDQKNSFGIVDPIMKKNEPMEISGTVLFLRYDFMNNLFLRTGFEANYSIKSAQMLKDDGMGIRQEYIFEYFSYTIPLYLGISLSPDRGRTAIYGAAGINYSFIEIKRESEITGMIFEIDSDSDLFGIGGIFGIERVLFHRVFLVMEYAFYAGSKSKQNNGTDGLMSSKFDQFSLPAQQMRAGLKYNF